MTNWQFCRSKLDSVANKLVKGSSLKSTNTYIDDIPDHVLVEILCRLPRLKFVCQCKVVSKRWCTLMAHRNFMTRFLQNKQTPQTLIINPKEEEFSPYFLTRFLKNKQTSHTLINPKGEEIFLKRMSPSSTLQKPLSEGLHRLKQTPFVVATFNDLVLCYATGYKSDCYYICNPFTNQWIALPPPPSPVSVSPTSGHRRMGFICDFPYYKYCNKDDDIQFNGEYNCKVVRLIFPDEHLLTYTASKKCFKVQIFSSNTGEWREFIVSSPSQIRYHEISRSFACDGVLYWMGGCDRDQFIFGVDPFMLKYEDDGMLCWMSGRGRDHFFFEVDPFMFNYRCHFLKIDKCGDYNELQCLGVNGDCMQLASIRLDGNNIILHVWDVNVNTVGTVKLSEEMGNIYSLNGMNLKYLHINFSFHLFHMLASDPDDPDVLYFQERMEGREVIISCNIRTGEWSEMYDQKYCQVLRYTDDDLFPLALSPWPTPLPRPPVGNRKIFGNSTFCWCAGVILLVLMFNLFVFFSKAQETDSSYQ